ncbi:MAG: NACHT domain-containing protein [bacterium]|nr:NACHT domain-containing protein [bacterium]
MTRTLKLGAAGEEAARHLADVYRLSPGFEPCVLISPHPRTLDELRRRLAEQAARLEPWTPTAQLGPLVEELAAAVRKNNERPVIWIQQAEFEPEPWRRALHALNWRREFYHEEAPWMWVLAGPDPLVELCSRHAPDLMSGVSVWRRIDELPALAPAGSGAERPIRWLHLSDFHFRGFERWDRHATLRALLRHAAGLREQDLAPDFVFVTGDLAWSGKREEYEQAERFFAELARVLELEPARDFFLVPGNHDVDRAVIGTAEELIVDGLKQQEEVERILTDPQAMMLLSRRLEGFYAFTERLLGAARAWRPDRPWRGDLREVRGVPIGIVQLNSAWTSGTRDEQGLLVGEAQVRQALDEAADAFLRVVLVHHPVADLRDFDRQRMETLLGAAGEVHFLLRGHLHRSRAAATRTPDGEMVELAAGAAYNDGEHPRRHLLTEADLAGGEARVRFFGYSNEGRGFWSPDTMAFEGAPQGVWSFELPPVLRLGEDAPPPTAPLSDARRATLSARYRAAAAAVHGTVRFIGFADHRPRPNVRVPELFVPLRLQPHEQGAKEEAWTTTKLLRCLAADEPARLVVLGDPGSGKTTLCRFAAVALAGEADLDGVEFPVELLPLFVPFRDYVRACSQEDRSLVAFLYDQARNQLQVPVPEGFFERALDDGRAVLLLDGLDEVGSAAQREEMRERVQAFCRVHPRVPALVTSRIAGYDDAPLPRGGSDAFVPLRLAPFEKQDLEQFVSHWYAVQEPGDPVARDRGIADLIAALGASGPVRELARNPMLATLIALVHRFEAHLPGERARLYDICVKTLLETWPTARRRRFGEIDEELQRVYLQALAFRMQSSRVGGPYGEVVISREELIAALVGIVGAHDPSAAAEQTRGLIERWVTFLAEGTGVLVEQRPGVFGFFHLSLLEYLAATWLEQAVSQPLADAIAERYRESAWHEVCLLAVGARATDRGFIDRLYRRLAADPEWERWPFLLRCLKEEAVFDDQQRAAIVRGAGRRLLEMDPMHWRHDQHVLANVVRLSIRHASWARAWLEAQLRSAHGEDLQAIVAIYHPEVRRIASLLAERPDAAVVVPGLLDFDFDRDLVRRVAGAVGKKPMLEWVNASAEELVADRSVAVLKSRSEPLAPLFLAALVRSACRTAKAGRVWTQSLAKRKRRGGRGLPAGIVSEPGPCLVTVSPGWPVPEGDRKQKATACERVFGKKYFARKCERDFLRLFGLNCAHYLARNFTLVLPSGLDLNEFFARYFTRDFTRDLSRYFSRNFVRHFIRYITDEFLPIASVTSLNQFSLDLTSEAHSRLPPDTVAVSGTLTGRKERPSRTFFQEEFTPARMSRQIAETWVGLATTVDRADEERAAYVHRRLVNVWLLNVWPEIDELLDQEPASDLLALYLALGWTQATTTWQWPATERWIAEVGGEAPEHWLPRSQWHLCWLLHDLEDEDHRYGLDEALRSGLEDEERPEIAVMLRELFPPSA